MKMQMRMAILALAFGLTAPGIAGAQTNGQLAVLDQAIRICSDPAVMPGDWDAGLAGWTRTEPTVDLIRRHAADRLFQDMVEDGQPFAAFMLPDLLDEHLILAEAFPEEVSYVEAGIKAEDGETRFYRHDSGWLLVLDLEEPDASESTCTISHREPDAGVMTYLEQPYLTAAPYRMIGGRGLRIMTMVPDGKSPAADVDFGLFVLDPAELPADAMPETHPARFASGVSVTVSLYASSREGRE